MIVNVIDQQSTLKISIDQVQQIVQFVIQIEGHSCDEVNLYFVDTSTISQLHEEYFQDSSTTDCISFPMDEDENENCPYRILGEVFICPETAVNYASQHSKSPYEETTLYIVHGLLHLMGYDDLTEKDELLMRQAESKHMQALKEHQLELYFPTD